MLGKLINDLVHIKGILERAVSETRSINELDQREVLLLRRRNLRDCSSRYRIKERAPKLSKEGDVSGGRRKGEKETAAKRARIRGAQTFSGNSDVPF